MIKVSAPGKCHLIGEHSVVYGEPAIIAAIGKRCAVLAKKSEDVIIHSRELAAEKKYSCAETIEFANNVQKLWDSCFEKKDFSELFELMKKDGMNPVKAAIGKALVSMGVNSGVVVRISSDIPIGAGLGSSSAMSISIVKAISELYEKNLSDEQINEITLGVERFNHGTPSGGDNSTCCFGGLIWFRRIDSKITIKSLKEEIPYAMKNFILVNTGRPKRTTGELVQQVRGLPDVFRTPRIKALGNIAVEMRNILKKRDFKKMKDLMNLAQKNLAELGVSTPEIDKLTKSIMATGGAAKLCGAGGGGTVLCYHEDRERLVRTVRESGYQPMEVELGVEGVRIDE